MISILETKVSPLSGERSTYLCGFGNEGHFKGFCGKNMNPWKVKLQVKGRMEINDSFGSTSQSFTLGASRCGKNLEGEGRAYKCYKCKMTHMHVLDRSFTLSASGGGFKRLLSDTSSTAEYLWGECQARECDMIIDDSPKLFQAVSSFNELKMLGERIELEDSPGRAYRPSMLGQAGGVPRRGTFSRPPQRNRHVRRTPYAPCDCRKFCPGRETSAVVRQMHRGLT
ncbi:hypothetical protein DFH11DRAFT_743841 [Phellopilus nigrolimitatus]|nr:hypothetical protein DFH11DRAFT_743841 [Phellopilus nigrolimitatus]